MFRFKHGFKIRNQRFEIRNPAAACSGVSDLIFQLSDLKQLSYHTQLLVLQDRVVVEERDVVDASGQALGDLVAA